MLENINGKLVIAVAKENVDGKTEDKHTQVNAKVTKEANCEATQIMQRMSTIAREILALSEHEVPTIKKA